MFELNSKTHTATIIDVTYWDQLVTFIKTKDRNWYHNNIAIEFSSYEVDYIGIYDLNKNLLNKSATSKIKTVDFIPKKLMEALYKSKLKRFYLRIPEGVVEVFGATIHPSNDPKKNRTNPSGYFFMARLLDTSFFDALGEISSSEINLVPKGYSNTIEDDFVIVSQDLKDWNNQVVSKLLFRRAFNLNYRNTKEILIVVVIASIINILVYLYFIRRWVYNPLKLITRILETGSEFAVEVLKKAQGV